MRRGSVLVDFAIDPGGCFETSRETIHGDPVNIVHDVVHYAVGDIPGVGQPFVEPTAALAALVA